MNSKFMLGEYMTCITTKYKARRYLTRRHSKHR